jgi:hypothetical protein
VVVKRRRIGVDVYDGHLAAVLAEKDVVRDDSRLVTLDELNQVNHGALQLSERPLTDVRFVDVDERLGHSRPPRR